MNMHDALRVLYGHGLHTIISADSGKFFCPGLPGKKFQQVF